MSSQQPQHEFHPHEPYVIEHIFSTGEVWRTCRAPGCRYNIGEGKDPASICKKHTTSEWDDPLPQLTDDIVAPVLEEDDPEPQVDEITVDGWVAAGEAVTAPVVDEPGDDEEVEEDSDEQEASDDETESASAEI
jgi:hypothetical protein